MVNRQEGAKECGEARSFLNPDVCAAELLKIPSVEGV